MCSEYILKSLKDVSCHSAATRDVDERLTYHLISKGNTKGFPVLLYILSCSWLRRGCGTFKVDASHTNYLRPGRKLSKSIYTCLVYAGNSIAGQPLRHGLLFSGVLNHSTITVP